MASKSKRRGRVFRASCILAALIIAGSSFAWFTSKDEVTNRLTASSDYGVSIVESFVPPKNIVPGETVNKDVYAVNTGNVDAFVKESISGILNYDYEEVVDSFAPTNVQLTTAQVTAIMGQVATEDGINTYEAGSYLAWTDAAGVKIGDVNIGRKADVDDETDDPAVPSNPWKPTVQGAYIFRRAINNGEESATNPFTYSGYYYVPAKDGNPEAFYKIVIGKDTYPDVVSKRDTDTDGDGDPTPDVFVYDIYTDFTDLTKKEDNSAFALADVDKDTGALKTAPLYKFVKLTEMDDKAVDLQMDATNKRLIATYGNGLGTATPESATAQAAAAQAAVAVQNAKGEYDAAVVSEKNAKANYDYATALANAENKLWKALDTYESKYSTSSSAEGTFNTERGEVSAYASAMLDGTGRTGLSPAMTDGILTISGTQATTEHDIDDGRLPLQPAVRSATTGVFTQNEWDAYDDNTGYTGDNPYVIALRGNAAYQNAMDTYIAAYKAIYGSNYNDADGLCKDIKEQLDIIKTNSADGINESDQDAANKVKAAVAQLKEDAKELTKQVNILKNAYIDLETEEKRVTGMGDPENTTAFDNLVATATAFTNNVNTLSGLADDYDEAEDAYNTAQDNLANAKADWITAINTYNTEVGAVTPGAKYTYTDTLDNQVNEKAWDTHTNKHVKEDDGEAIVPVWSAITENDDNNPAFTEDEVTALSAYDGNGTRPTLTRAYNIRQITDANMPTEGHDTTKVTDTIGDNYGTTTTKYTYEEWQTQVAAKKVAWETAQGVLNDANVAVGSASNIKFFINLADDYATYWTFDNNTNNTTQADFYLNKILTAGETSHKLVDSVEFANTVTPSDYRNLTFDLDVALNSAQATYEANNYSTDAVDSDENFKMVANVTSPATEGSNVTWGAAPVDGVSTTTYQMDISGTKHAATLTKLESATSEGYTYKAEVDDDDDSSTDPVVYYGKSNQKNSEFVLSTNTNAKGTLVVNRT